MQKNNRAIKKKAVSGFIYLLIRRLLVQVIQTAGNVILARLLFPHDFGVFTLIIFYASLSTIVLDLGLYGSLLQKSKNPSKEDLQRIFSFQIVVTVITVVILFLIVPFYSNLYPDLENRKYINLIYLACTLPIFTNLRLIPYSLIERSLEYKKIVIGEVSETLLYVILAVLFVLLGRSVSGLIYATVISKGLATLLFYMLHPWDIGLRFDFYRLKSHFSFGIPFQFNYAIGVLNGSISPIIVGGLIGAEGVGFISWAGGLGAFPRFIGEIMSRIIFPFGARIQDNKELFIKTFDQSMQTANIATIPFISVMLPLSKEITDIIFTSKWLPGVTSMQLFILQSLFLVWSAIITNSLMSLGKSKLVGNINLFSLLAQWLITIPLVHYFNFTGFAISSFIISLNFIIFYVELRKLVPIKIFSSIYKYIFYGFCTFVIIFVLKKTIIVNNFIELVLMSIFGLIIYFVFIVIFERNYLKNVYQLLVLVRPGDNK